MEELIASIVEDLSIELADDAGYSEAALTAKTRNAYREAVQARHYPADYTDEMIENDMQQFFSVIRDVALYDYNMIGKDFQTSHTENGVTRGFRSRDALFDITPFAHF
jgi:hypothetical protein